MPARDVDYLQAYTSKIGHSNRNSLLLQRALVREAQDGTVYFPFFILAMKLCSYVLLHETCKHETHICILEMEVIQAEMMKYNTILDIVCEYSW